jgi:translation initiation factor IF-3
LFWRTDTISTKKRETRLNDRITAPEVRLIGVEGEQLGVVALSEALVKAQEAGVDLVEISPTAVPPVCRLMDFGKFQYQTNKRRQAAKRKQKQIQVKEIKFRPGTDVGDYQVKVRNLIRFLQNGDKAKVTLRFRGREMRHQQLGLALLKRVAQDLAAYGTVEQQPSLEGRQMVMVVNPKPGSRVAPGRSKVNAEAQD